MPNSDNLSLYIVRYLGMSPHGKCRQASKWAIYQNAYLPTYLPTYIHDQPSAYQDVGRFCVVPGI